MANYKFLWMYFVLAFAISWGGVLAAAGTGRFRGEATSPEILMAMLWGMLLGPFAGGLLATAAAGGLTGLGELARRMLPWRASAGWYAALLLNPLLTLAVLAGFATVVSPDYRPVFSSFGILGGLLVGLVEETGWTGFATPHLLEKHTPLKAALILGLLHGGWHLLSGFIGSMPGQEGLWAIEALVFWVAGITAYRVLMTWVYIHTRSLLLGQLMHMVFTGAFLTFIPALDYARTVPVYIFITGGLWVMAGLVIARYGSSLAGKETARRAALV